MKCIICGRDIEESIYSEDLCSSECFYTNFWNKVIDDADNYWGGLNEAFEVAIKALEKEIPKHIEEQTEDDREFIDYVCPNCKTTLQQKRKGAKLTTIYKYKHCIFCGQVIDWSDRPTEKGGAE